MSDNTLEQIVIDVTPEQIITEWIDDLRTTDALQGSGYLAQKGEHGIEYCCLGRLSEIGVKHGLLARIDGDVTVCYRWQDDNPREDILPQGFAEWLGIDQDPEVNDENLKASTANDDYFESFAEIAVQVHAHILPRIKGVQHADQA